MAYGGLTPLGAEARARTTRYADGLGMLVHQAARAVELALGEAAAAAAPLPRRPRTLMTWRSAQDAA